MLTNISPYTVNSVDNRTEALGPALSVVFIREVSV